MQRVAHIKGMARRGACRGVLTLALIASLAVGSAHASAASPAEFDSPTARNATSSAVKGSSPWAWANAPSAWTQANGVLPTALVGRGPTTPISRAQFLDSLLRIEDMRTAQGEELSLIHI